MPNIVACLGYVSAVYLIYKIITFTLQVFHRFTAKPVDVRQLGQWAAITGATDGIGKAYAFALAKTGLNIILISRSQEKLKNVAAEIESKYKVKTKTVAVDFKDDEKNYAPRLEKELSGMEIGVLVNNVGMFFDNFKAFLDVDSAMVRDMINVNLVSLNVMTRLVLPSMVERKKGAIVNIGSIAAIGIPFMLGVYAATKAYMAKLTESLQIEYGDSGVIIQCVHPGEVATNMNQQEPNLFAPTPEVFVKSALGRLGVESFSYGYWAHDFVAFFIQAMPRGLMVRMTKAGIMKKLEEKKKKKQ